MPAGSQGTPGVSAHGVPRRKGANRPRTFGTVHIRVNQYNKEQTATLTETGSAVKQAQKSSSISGVLSFSGSITRAILHVLAAVLSFTGAVTKFTSRTLPAGTLSFTGSFIRSLVYVLSATLSFGGSTTKNTSRSLSGTLSFTGAIVKQTSRALAGALSFVGTLIPPLAYRSAKIPGVTSHGVPRRRGPGNAPRYFMKETTVHARVNSYNQDQTAALSTSGNVVKSTNRSLAATLGFSGSIRRLITIPFSATASFTGNITKSASYGLSATLSFSGSILKRTSYSLAGTLSFAGNLTKKTFVPLTATLSFSGNVTTIIGLVFKAAIGFNNWMTDVGSFGSTEFGGGNNLQTPSIDALVKQTFRSVSGQLTFVTTFIANVQVFFGAMLTFSGSTTRSIDRSLSSVLSFSGSTFRQLSKLFTAALSFNVSGSPFFGFGGEDFGGFILNSSIDSLTKETFRAIPAALSFTPVFTKMTLKVLSGGMSFLTNLGIWHIHPNLHFKELSSHLTFTPVFAWSIPIKVAFTASLSFTSSLTQGMPSVWWLWRRRHY